MCTCSRRDFIRGLAVAAGASAVAACGVPSGPSGPSGSGSLGGDIAAGNISGLTAGQLRVVSGSPLILGRDAGGAYAMSAVCPHADCDMTVNGQISSAGVTCDCHGSEFNANGNVVLGPARTSLTHYSLSIDSTGVITVHSGQPVAQATRTPA